MVAFDDKKDIEEAIKAGILAVKDNIITYEDMLNSIPEDFKEFFIKNFKDTK